MRVQFYRFVLVMVSLWASLGLLSAGERLEVVEHLGDPGSATCLVVYGDSLWVGTKGAGMIRWDGERAKPMNEGLPGLGVNDCSVHQGELWVATDSGLALASSPEQGFFRYAEGRFLKVSSRRDGLVAMNDQGVALELTLAHLNERGWHAREVQLELVPSALGIHSQGRWAAADLSGLIRVASVEVEKERASVDDEHVEVGPRIAIQSFRVPEPVTALSYDGDVLRIKVPGGGYRLEETDLVPDPQLAEDGFELNAQGLAFPVPDLSERTVRDVVRWRDVDYLATDDGVFKMEGEEVHQLALGGMPCGARVVAVATFEGALWVGSFDRGLCRLDQSGWTRFQAPRELPSNRVNDMVATDKHLYVATDLGLVVVDRKGRFVQRTVEECSGNLNRKCPWHASVNGVAVDRRDQVPWMADIGAVHRMRGRRWRRFYRNKGLASQKLTRIAAQDGMVAVGTSDQGVFLRRGRRDFTRHDDQNGLTDNWVMDLAFDAQGRLWVATCTKGLSVLEKGRWRSFGVQQGLADDYTLAVQEIDGRMWVGTLSGLTVMGKDGPINLTTLEGLSGNEVHAFVVHDERVYVATDGGLTVIRYVDDAQGE